MLALHFQEEMTLAEVTAILNIPLGMTKSRLPMYWRRCVEDPSGLRASGPRLIAAGFMDDECALQPPFGRQSAAAMAPRP